MRLVYKPLEFQFASSDTVRFVPMNFGNANCTISQPYLSDALHFSPPAGTELLAKPHDVPDFPTDRNRFNITDTPYDFEVHICFLSRPT